MKGDVNDPKRISPYDLNGIAKLSSSPMSLTDSLLTSRHNSEPPLDRIATLEAELTRTKSMVERLIEAGNAVNRQNLDLSIDGDCTVNYVWDNIVMECQSLVAGCEKGKKK